MDFSINLHNFDHKETCYEDMISSSKEQKKLLNSFSKIVTYYSLALFLLIGGSCMWSNQFCFDLKLGRYIQSRIGSR